MCGIVAYVGTKKDTNFLIEKLKKLEYRGYDSAGLASLMNNRFEVYKEIGKIVNLEQKLEKNSILECAISHTRWATNGKVNVVNSHPHLSKDGNWAIVHNGIIENYAELKSHLKLMPDSDTDTAVVAEGLDEMNAHSIFDFINYFKKVSGGFAIVAINKHCPKTLFLAKRKNPLYVSENESGDFMVASDPICFDKFSKTYYLLEDDEFAKIEDKKIVFYNKNKTPINKDKIMLTEDFEDAQKYDFSTFMLKEILEEDKVLKKQVEIYKSKNLLSRFDKNFLKKFDSIKLIGCGTAYHACLVGAKYFQKILNINASAEIASEFIYNEPIFANKKTLFIFVSQSGETADLLKAVEIAKSKGSTCLAFTNVMYSSLTKKADITLPICAGVEIAVASTKAYICQMSALYMFVCHLSNEIKNTKIGYFVEIGELSDVILHFDQLNVKNIAKKIYKKEKCFFIGKDLDYITALESALKVNETTYINSNCYPSGELKHGYLALIEKGTPIFIFATQEKLKVKTYNSSEEASSRGAERILITDNPKAKCENKIVISKVNEYLLPIISIVPMQFLACEISRLKGIDPDQPRNLAKSVTVE